MAFPHSWVWVVMFWTLLGLSHVVNSRPIPVATIAGPILAVQEYPYVLRSSRPSCRHTKEAQCSAVLGIFYERRGCILAFC
jgi:hypothetical protein